MSLEEVGFAPKPFNAVYGRCVNRFMFLVWPIDAACTVMLPCVYGRCRLLETDDLFVWVWLLVTAAALKPVSCIAVDLRRSKALRLCLADSFLFILPNSPLIASISF